MKAVVATRKSALALAQARAFVRTLEQANPGLSVQELHVTTTGDRIQDRALSEIGGKGLFIKEVEQALLEGQATFAVHSMKDVPGELARGLRIACIPLREDAHDVLITRSGQSLSELAPASRVGTSSLRRSVQLLVARPDLEIVPLRGNVDTRLRRCAEGAVDAIVLARAGLIRLSVEPAGAQILSSAICLPAVGQGALGIECREDDSEMSDILARVDDLQTHVSVSAERGVMVAVEGSCQIPIAAYAVRDGDSMILRGMLAESDGTRLRRGERRAIWPSSVAEAYQIGLDLGHELKAG